MSWRSYVFPQIITITSSPYNHHIRVNEEWGKMKLIVNGSPQSGTYIEMLWQNAMNHFALESIPIQSVLILGLGGGTVLHMLEKRFPGIKETCVEIDKTIIDIAKKYFELSDIPHLMIVHEDAKVSVRRLAKQRKTFDCVIVDLSFGRNIPSFVGDQEFLKEIRKMILPNGCLLVNYLREKEYKEKSDFLQNTLKTIFPIVQDFEIANNRFFYARLM